MANTVIINGDTRKFTINENVKRYSLIDVGFVKSPKGNFVYEHPLYNESPYNAPTKLKMTINQDLDHLTMVITDKNGLQKVNIFKNDQLKPTVDLLNFILKDLIEREIIKPL
ncbi:DUF1831 domain-containing protein [Lactobacillus jensenii]|jgi:hypothetical protein|uniref:DUF1831 domain-containing protein n=1 Tax=Lactobacillus jensenii TaxID=109790 RepID=A0A5N1IDD2_LACJE|nr:DUF1831 domain-containing protein [Lactobacillus jensenii]EEQ68153.1 hypothetical protein LBJG_00581 [Lactobacillus jensenii 1153]ERJ42766.1 hypothetical protein N581_04390 [Lactobacillus jensenii MD IIE-70(2)]APT14949.1 hypothetical protein BUE77_05795 [Lactobacillus jensenii]EEQ24469.1 hypothetical protein LACJE0001_1239 [Lactobacillus jensenii 269-3]EEX27655.1 hypothetical protein HMPREF0527_00707 [Lactobacillus jensenii SJ-7A-US]